MRVYFLLYMVLIMVSGGILISLFPGGYSHFFLTEPKLKTKIYSNHTRFEKPLKSTTPKIEKADTATIYIPLKRIGKLFMIEATIDGETGNLVFDTGASCLVLNATYFRNHVSFGQQTPAGITGSLGNEERVTADKLNLGKLNFKKVSATLSNLGHIENKRGVKVLGLFGFELIKQYEIQIDYANNLLKLFRIDKKGALLNSSASFRADYIQNFDELHNILFLKGKISEKSLRFCFDTGAETNVLSTDLPNAVLQTVTITRTSKLRGAGSSQVDVIYGRMNNFMFGDSAFRNMETVIAYLDNLNESYGTHLDGVVGFDFISKGTFCINFVKKTMGIAFYKTEEQ